MSLLVGLASKGWCVAVALATDPPPSVTLVTKDAAPAKAMSWWLLPLVLGLAGAGVGALWWWWRRADALERDPAAWATQALLAVQPRARRGQLKGAARRLNVPVLALLMSEHAARAALGEASGHSTTHATPDASM